MTDGLSGRSTQHGRRRADDGAYLVLYALLLVAIFAMVALVLDIAGLRQARRGDRLAADLAATAGAALVDPTVPATAATACQAAWDYVELNIDDEPGPVTAPSCAGTFASVVCDPSAPISAIGTRGSVRITITHPVPDVHPLMRAEVAGGDAAQAIDATADGQACERLGVRIERTRSFLFGGFVGDSSGTSDVHAVARRAVSTTTEAPGVVALEPSGCNALTTTSDGVTLTVAGASRPGIIDVDSTGASCSFVIDTQSPGRLIAEGFGPSTGRFSSHAAGVGNVASAYDPADLAAGALSPVPVPVAAPRGRSFVDTRYSTAIATLRATLGGAGTPAGFTAPPLLPCTVPAPVSPLPAVPVIVPAGDVFVDCPDAAGGFVVESGAQVTFEGGTVVFAGGIDVRNGGCLAVHHDGCGGVAPLAPADNVVYLRSGNLVKAETGTVHLSRTVVHLSGNASSAGTGQLTMPANQTATVTGLTWTPPSVSSGDFEDLALWSESGAASMLGAQTSTVTNGLFFAPNATLTLSSRSGGPTTFGGQLVARRIAVDGTTPLRVVTDPSVAATAQTASVRLIR